MIQATLTESKFMSIMEDLFPEPANAAPAVAARYVEKMHKLNWLFTDAETNKAVRGTRWAGYQALTEYIDHYAPAQRTQWTSDIPTARAMRSLGNASVTLKERAFGLINA